MFKWLWRRGKNQYKKREKDIDPDEIFIDSENLPNFDTFQFEGRLEKSISQRSIFILSGVFFLVIIIFIFRIWILQINEGDINFSRSENNRLRSSLVFAKRGIIYDRNGVKLAWNVKNPEEGSFDFRKYISTGGFSHLLGYIKYPQKDKAGFYYTQVFSGKENGVEEFFNTELSGKNGSMITEVDALGKIQSENIMISAKDGKNITLTIDSDIQAKMYQEIKELGQDVGFPGGAGVIMDVKSGAIIAMTSYPEYDSQILTDGQDNNTINKYLNDKNTPFLNRVINGLYAPGSTVKPFVALAALNENIIDPYKNIYGGDYISIPNPYDSAKPTIFRDWKAHGYVDMKKAIAVSSDIYFYAIGGGYEDQKGLGILNIDKYMKMFGFGDSISEPFFSGQAGVIPTPEWKKEKFAGDDWRLGNTYHTAIGQYGFQISPIQMVKAMSSLANGGKMVEPKILLEQENEHQEVVNLNLNKTHLKIIDEGMRDGVIKDYGTVRGLDSPNFSVAAKTGTAEIGVYKQFVNSWVIGFFPYENPKYAFVIIMEKGPAENKVGASYVMRQILDYMFLYKPEYLK